MCSSEEECRVLCPVSLRSPRRRRDEIAIERRERRRRRRERVSSRRSCWLSRTVLLRFCCNYTGRRHRSFEKPLRLCLREHIVQSLLEPDFSTKEENEIAPIPSFFLLLFLFLSVSLSSFYLGCSHLFLLLLYTIRLLLRRFCFSSLICFMRTYYRSIRVTTGPTPRHRLTTAESFSFPQSWACRSRRYALCWLSLLWESHRLDFSTRKLCDTETLDIRRD